MANSDSQDNSDYVHIDGEKITILEEGFLTPEFLPKVRFEFRDAADITEALHKNKDSQQQKEISVTHTGRTAYAGLTAIYPDKKESSNIAITSCVIQYSIGMEKEKSKYGIDFVLIGIPAIYVDRLIRDAKNNSGLTLGVKERVQQMSGFYWMQCSLEKIVGNEAKVIFEDDKGETKETQVKLTEAMKEAKTHYLSNISFTVSATATSDSLMKKIDLKNTQYNLTVKPTEIYLLDESNVEVPKLPDIQRRKNESSEVCQSHVAKSNKLAAMAMRNLKIG